MQNYFQRKFALTPTGARGLVRSIVYSFIMYVLDMAPVMLFAYFLQGLLIAGLSPWWHYALVAVFIGVAMYVMLRLEYDAQFSATYRESASLRTGLARRLSRLPLSYFSRHDVSDISQTIMADVEGIENIMSPCMPKVYAFYAFAPLILLLMFLGLPLLALAVLLPLSLSLLLIRLSARVQMRGHQRVYALQRENAEAFQEAIELAHEIQSYRMEGEVGQELRRMVDARERANREETRKGLLIVACAQLLGYLTLPSLLLVGVWQLRMGSLTVFLLLLYLISAIKLKELMDGMVEFMSEMYHLDPKVKTIQGIRETATQEGEEEQFDTYDVRFEHTAFAYDERSPVLRDVSFTAKQGEVTALVGASGCGKTSILRLVSRLYDSTGGRILIGGKNLSELSTDALFRRVSIVFQEVQLFNTAVLENIRIGRLDATDEEVMRAAEAAGCTDFISGLPEGFQTRIGENGAELSGGERQRLSIARAFLKDAPILLLDEIAASLDVYNEETIQRSLNRLIKNKTVIIISHRLRSIEGVDHIVVLDEGRVEAEGTHRELLEGSRVYSNLIEKTHRAEAFVY